MYSNILFTYIIFTEHPHFLLMLPVNVQQNIKGWIINKLMDFRKYPKLFINLMKINLFTGL